MRIAVAAEITPARTLIPILKKLDADVLGLAHGDGAKEILSPYCYEVLSIGSGRRAGAKKRSNFEILKLVLKDINKTRKILSKSNVDLVITCGNAGDVRKALSASKLLGIPRLHVEQDIYNPIEMIAFANIVTAPSDEYKLFLEEEYSLNNVFNIGGYPMVDFINKKQLLSREEVYNKYSCPDEYVVVALGGDLRYSDIEKIISVISNLNFQFLIVPFRFDKHYVDSLVKTDNIHVLSGYVDLPSLMKYSSAVIYGAGMGITIEATVLGVPAIKILGFHKKHASVDLAKKVGICISEINDIPNVLDMISKPNSNMLIEDSINAIDNLVSLINSYDDNLGKGNFNSITKIWNARSKFR